MPEHIENSNHKYIILFLMAGVTLLSIFVLSQQSLRLDEAQSLWQTSHSTQRVLEIVSEDVHVPLYHLLLHYWQLAWGNGVFAARALSLIFFVLTIPAVYALGRITFGPKVGLFAAILVAVSPFMNWFGSEIRMYSLFTLITVLNQYLFVRIYKHPANAFTSIPETKWDEDKKISPAVFWLGYAATAILGMYTHYFFLFVPASQALFILAYRKGFAAHTIRNFMITGGVTVAAFVPWLIKVIQADAVSYAQPILARPELIDVFNSFSQFMFGFHDDGINTIILSLWPIMALLAFLALGKRTFISHDAFYFAAAALIPIAAVFAASLVIRPFYLTRLFIFAVPSLYILLGWIMHTYNPRVRKFVGAILIAGMAGGLVFQTANPAAPIKENYADANKFLVEHATAQDVILIAPPFTIYPFEYYYTGPAAVKTMPEWDRLVVGPIPEFPHDNLDREVRRLTQNYRNAWVLVSFLGQGYEEELASHFENNYERVAHIELSHGLELYGYRIRYDNLRAGVEEVARQ